MIGSVAASYSPQQIRTAKIHSSLEEQLPQVLRNIVADYAIESPSPELVARRLEKDKNGLTKDSVYNHTTLNAIESALSEPGFDLAAKQTMISQASIFGDVKAINDVMDRIRARGETIYLDKADFTDFDLRDFDFSDVSLTGANFSSATVTDVSFKNADLTDANLSDASIANSRFDGATLLHTNMTNTTLRESSFVEATFSDLTLDGTNLYELSLTGAQFNQVRFRRTFVSAVSSDDPKLQAMLSAEADTVIAERDYSSPK